MISESYQKPARNHAMPHAKICPCRDLPRCSDHPNDADNSKDADHGQRIQRCKGCHAHGEHQEFSSKIDHADEDAK